MRRTLRPSANPAAPLVSRKRREGKAQSLQKPPITSPTVDNGQYATGALRARGGVWPYTQQWSLTFEHQTGSGTSVRAAYVGVKGTRLHAQDATNWNQLDPRYLALGNPLTAQIASPQSAAAGRADVSGIRDPLGKSGDGRAGIAPFPLQWSRPSPRLSKLPRSESRTRASGVVPMAGGRLSASIVRDPSAG